MTPRADYADTSHEYEIRLTFDEIATIQRTLRHDLRLFAAAGSPFLVGDRINIKLNRAILLPIASTGTP